MNKLKPMSLHTRLKHKQLVMLMNGLTWRRSYTGVDCEVQWQWWPAESVGNSWSLRPLRLPDTHHHTRLSASATASEETHLPAHTVVAVSTTLKMSQCPMFEMCLCHVSALQMLDHIITYLQTQN